MSKSKVTFYMMRHGFCDCFGELTPEGKEEVRKSTEKNLTGIKFARAYSSPESRTRETMKIILDNTNDVFTRNNQLDIKIRKRLGLGVASFEPLKEIMIIASKVAHDTAPDGKDECNIMIVTHSSNILACSGACPTMPEPNYADIVRLEIEVTGSSTWIVSTQRIPRGF